MTNRSDGLGRSGSGRVLLQVTPQFASKPYVNARNSVSINNSPPEWNRPPSEYKADQ